MKTLPRHLAFDSKPSPCALLRPMNPIVAYDVWGGAVDADWDEGAHKRADNGQFGSGGETAKVNAERESTRAEAHSANAAKTSSGSFEHGMAHGAAANAHWSAGKQHHLAGNAEKRDYHSEKAKTHSLTAEGKAPVKPMPAKVANPPKTLAEHEAWVASQPKKEAAKPTPAQAKKIMDRMKFLDEVLRLQENSVPNEREERASNEFDKIAREYPDLYAAHESAAKKAQHADTDRAFNGPAKVKPMPAKVAAGTSTKPMSKKEFAALPPEEKVKARKAHADHISAVAKANVASWGKK